MRSKFKILPLWFVAGLMGLAIPCVASATGSYFAQSFLEVSVVAISGPAGFVIEGYGQSFPDDNVTDTSGDGTAEAFSDYSPTTSTPLQVNDAVTVESRVSGTADNGSASSLVLSSAYLDMDNPGPGTATVTLGYSYSVEATASANNPPAEQADALATIEVASNGANPISESWMASADGVTGPTSAEDIGSGEWTIEVPPGNTRISVSGFIDSEGGAIGVTPTYALLSAFSATDRGGQVVVEWSTSMEMGTVGFHLERLNRESGEYERVNDELLLGLLDAPQGGEYSYVDSTAEVGRRYSYRLTEVEARGSERVYGPFEVRVRPERRARALRGRAVAAPPGLAAPAIAEDRRAIPDPGIRGYERRAHPRPAAPGAAKGQGGLQGLGVEPLEAAATALAQPVAMADVLPAAEPRTLARVLVGAGGIYEIGAEALAAALDQPLADVIEQLRARQVSLTHRGIDVGWEALRGGAGLRFFAQALSEQEYNLYSDTNVYWLELGAQSQTMGWVMGLAPRQAASAQAVYPAEVGWEENLSERSYYSDDPEADIWMWKYAYAGTASDVAAPFDGLEVPAAASGGEAVLRIELMGNSDFNGPLEPDHHLVVKINGNQVDDADIDEPQWNGRDYHTAQVRFDQSWLDPSGVNGIEIGGIMLVAPYSYFWVDRFELTYWRHYVAEGDMARVKAGDEEVLTVRGLGCAAQDLAVYDISDPRRPKVYRGRLLKRDIPGEVSFKANGGSEFLALCKGVVQTPQLEAATPTSWLAADNAYDYVLIAPQELLAGAQELADYRAGKGYNTAVFDLQGLYDACNGGIAHARAIKDCLSWAHGNWQKTAEGLPLPSTVVFVGEGTIDPKDHLGWGENRLPVRECATPFGMFPCDNWYADFDGDGVPEIVNGRVPVRDNAEMSVYVQKVKDYEAGTYQLDGSGKMLWTADDPDNPDNPDSNHFHIDSDKTAVLVDVEDGGFYQVDKVYYSAGDDAVATRSQIHALLEAGPEVFHWTGHGGITKLADENLYRVTDAETLTNGRTPIFVALTCGVGYGAYPNKDSLVEALVVRDTGSLGGPGHGAVAAFAPTGLSLNDKANLMDQVFIDALYLTQDAATLGDAVLMAIEAVGGGATQRFMRDIYHIWGDPALVPWR